MKKALFLALSLAFLLTACGETTLPDTSEQNPVDNTQETSLPESCLLYYDLGDASILAEDKSLPLAQNAGDGYQTSYSVWYDGEYQDLALQDSDSGISVADMTGGSAVFDYGAGLVVWNGERYHCARLTAQDSYIGKYTNDYDNECLLISAIQGYFLELERGRLLQKDYSQVDIDVDAVKNYQISHGLYTKDELAKMSDLEIKKLDTKKKVFLTAKIKILDAMEDIELPINI